jgi:cytochrome c5
MPIARTGSQRTSPSPRRSVVAPHSNSTMSSALLKDYSVNADSNNGDRLMSRGKLLFGALSITVAMLGAAAAQRADLPAGPNQDVVSRACQACHDLSMVVAATGLTREGWNATIEEMISYGMRVDKEDREKILEYLSSYLGSR